MVRKGTITGVFGFLGMLVLILDSKTALYSASQGITLCITSLIPSLFPFFVASGCLTGVLMGRCSPIMKLAGKVFHMPEGAEGLLAPALLGGYPVGAQCIAQAYRSGLLPKQEANRLLQYCSNAGPAFLFGVVSPMLPEKMTVPLWLIHILSVLMVSGSGEPAEVCPVRLSPENTGIRKAMETSLHAMAAVCGWVILFRILIGYLERWVLWIFPTELQVLICGLLELTNGCLYLHRIENTGIRFLVCSSMLSLGGICVAMQTGSVIRELSMRCYLAGKLQQGIYSLLLGALYLCGGLVLPLLVAAGYTLMLRSMEKTSGNPKKAVV